METMEQAMINSQVKFQDMRERLIKYLLGLSDEEYQKNIWITSKSSTGFYSNLYYPIGLILEEQGLEEEGRAKRTIGQICKNEEEAIAVEKVAKLLDEITDEVYAEDSYYLNSPLYPKMVKAAREAYNVFIENEKDNKEFLDFIEVIKANMRKKIEENKNKLIQSKVDLIRPKTSFKNSINNIFSKFTIDK